MAESPQGDALPELTEFAVDLARCAGRLTLEYFGRGVDPDWKEDGTPVTVADRGAEELLRRAVSERFPDDGLFGEEYGQKQGTSGRTWIFDPIDGTKSFVRGVPLYGVLIGLEIAGEIAAGVIHLPALDETVWAWSGGGCWCNGERSRVSEVAELDRSLLCLSDIFLEGELGRLPTAVGLRRTWGDCYGYALVATGRAEIMVDPEVNPWDIAAVKPILEEAGGRFTDRAGVATIRGHGGVGTNGRVHDEVLELLSASAGDV